MHTLLMCERVHKMLIYLMRLPKPGRQEGIKGIKGFQHPIEVRACYTDDAHMHPINPVEPLSFNSSYHTQLGSQVSRARATGQLNQFESCIQMTSEDQRILKMVKIISNDLIKLYNTGRNEYQQTKSQMKNWYFVWVIIMMMVMIITIIAATFLVHADEGGD